MIWTGFFTDWSLKWVQQILEGILFQADVSPEKCFLLLANWMIVFFFTFKYVRLINYSFCNLLFQTGLLKLSDEEFFIQPLEKSKAESSAPQAHAIYRRHASPSPSLPVIQQVSGRQAHQGTCGVQSTKKQTETAQHTKAHTSLMATTHSVRCTFSKVPPLLLTPLKQPCVMIHPKNL